MMTALLAARNILAGENKFDVWSVNEDAEYHEAGQAGEQSASGAKRTTPPDKNDKNSDDCSSIRAGISS
jgi:hypothetical protein